MLQWILGKGASGIYLHLQLKELLGSTLFKLVLTLVHLLIGSQLTLRKIAI